jgi:hypothetical protein
MNNGDASILAILLKQDIDAELEHRNCLIIRF